jgi:hypothetical protein
VIFLETKFISLDKKESSYEKIDMPRRIVFYPYFHFRNPDTTILSKDGPAVSESDKAYRARLSLDGFSVEKLIHLEKALFPGRIDEYGFWTAEYSGGYYIGLGAASLKKFMEHAGTIKASYVVLKGSNILFVADIDRENGAFKDVFLDVYLCPGDGSIAMMLPEVSQVLSCAGLFAGELKAESADYSAVKYIYSGANAVKFKSGKRVFLPKQDPKPFKEQVAGCTWHTTVVNDDVVSDGPRFVLLKNSGQKLGNILDELSNWMVHRRGGFVTGKEFSEGDFHQDTTYIIKEIDEYLLGDVIVLNIECDTYSNNFDSGFEDFLKNLSETRLQR